MFTQNNSKFKILNSKKKKEFYDWTILVNIYYYGYHRLPEGISLINDIKSQWNNFRLSNNKDTNKNNNTNNSFYENSMNKKYNYLLNIPSPYDLKNGNRFLRNTDTLVS
jgi:hypothetical protein